MHRARTGFLLAMLIIGCYGYFAQPHGYSQMSRIAMLYAMINEGTLAIDTLHEYTSDKGLFEGHYYSTKPPGLTYLAIPVLTLALPLERLAGIDPYVWDNIAISLWIATAGTVGILAGLGVMATWMLLLHVCRRPGLALVATLGCWLGTLAFPYGITFLPHVATMGMLSIALCAVLLPVPAAAGRRFAFPDWWHTAAIIGIGTTLGITFWTGMRAAGMQPDVRLLTFMIGMLAVAGGALLFIGTLCMLLGLGGAKERHRRMALAGLACGLAVVTEFPAVIGVSAVCLLAARRGGLPALRRAALWAMVPVLLLLLTNWLCFGSPLRLGYDFSQFPWMDRGFFGITLSPKIDAFSLLLFSPAKGLLFWSPFLVFVVPGLRELYDRDRTLFWACLVTSVLGIVAITTTGNPGGGAAVGPRYLAPIIPFLMLPAALGMAVLPKTGITLVGVSITMNTLAAAVNPHPSERFLNPLFDEYIPSFIGGMVAPNAGSLIGIDGVLSLFPLIGFCAALIGVLWLESRRLSRKH